MKIDYFNSEQYSEKNSYDYFFMLIHELRHEENYHSCNVKGQIDTGTTCYFNHELHDIRDCIQKNDGTTLV